ncbi:MAG: hypothetical protein ACI4SF_01075 [Oscillospiraceae bacterium]
MPKLPKNGCCDITATKSIVFILPIDRRRSDTLPCAFHFMQHK